MSSFVIIISLTLFAAVTVGILVWLWVAHNNLIRRVERLNVEILEASKDALVLVDFWADWCGPCKQLTPVIENVVRSYGGKVRLAKLNVDQHPAISGQLRIQSLPTVYAFLDGRPVDGFAGVQPERRIRPPPSQRR